MYRHSKKFVVLYAKANLNLLLRQITETVKIYLLQSQYINILFYKYLHTFSNLCANVGYAFIL